MDILTGIKKDIKQGIKQGIGAVKSTATLVKDKAEELTEKGKSQYLLYELKNKEQKQFTGLGAKLHQMVATEKINISNQELKKLLTAINRTQAEITKLEGKGHGKAAKKTAKKKAPATKQKKVAQKTTS